MPIAHANGIDICYEVDGPGDNAPLLLVNGYTSQLNSWTPGFVDQLVDAGFRVVRFDNRDVGLTTRATGDPPAYTLADMAADGMALLTELGIDKAHIVGASMGGMIVQRMAIDHPDRVLSMTSIMSTTGDTSVGTPQPEAMAALLKRPPADRGGYIDHAAEMSKVISGPLYDEERARTRATNAFDRAFYPEGALFQMAAITSDKDRTAELGNLRCPVLVIHGKVDPLVTLSGGEATAKAIPGAELLVLDDMGHDLPPQLLPEIVTSIAKVAARA